MYKYLCYLIIFSLFLSACKKSDTDLLSPTIEVSNPSVNQSFVFGDTILIQATIKDDISLKKIKISVLDKFKNYEVLTPITFYDCGKEKDIIDIMAVNNPVIESDLYYIAIVADDGTNTKRFFIPIYIRGLARTMLGIIYISNENYNTLEVHQIDTLGVDLKKATLFGDYALSEINSKYQLLFVAGAHSGNLNALNLMDNTISWSIPNQTNNASPWFYSLYVQDNAVFVGTQNSAITAYSVTGMPIKAYTSLLPWHATKIIETEGRIIAQTETVPTAFAKITQFYSGSGEYLSQEEVPFLTTHFFSYNSENILVLANRNEVGEVYLYDFIRHSLNSLATLSAEKIIDAVKVDSYRFLILTPTRILMLNTAEQNNLYQLNLVSGGIQLLFDAQTNLYYVVKNQQIDIFALNDFSLKNTITATKTITKAHLYYNR